MHVADLAGVQTARVLTRVLLTWMPADSLVITTVNLLALHMLALGEQLVRTCTQAMLAIAGNTYRIRQPDR